MGFLTAMKEPACTYVHQTAMYRKYVAVLEERGTVGKTREGIICESRVNHFAENVVTFAPKAKC